MFNELHFAFGSRDDFGVVATILSFICKRLQLDTARQNEMVSVAYLLPRVLVLFVHVYCIQETVLIPIHNSYALALACNAYFVEFFCQL